MVMGLKALWGTSKEWINSTLLPKWPEAATALVERKRADIPLLHDYETNPGTVFWQSFPSRLVSEVHGSRMDAGALGKAIAGVGLEFTCHMLRRGYKACNDLTQGADSCIVENLPGIFVKNCQSALDNGCFITEKLATWIENDFVAGPFDSPPFVNFRVNPLMAVVKGASVRPVINLSAPAGRSYNDKVVSSKVEKVKMAFAYSLFEAGRGALFSKQDAKDAYKNVPARKSDWHKQGFMWLGKYFSRQKQCLEQSLLVAILIGRLIQFRQFLESGPVSQKNGHIEPWTISPQWHQRIQVCVKDSLKS